MAADMVKCLVEARPPGSICFGEELKMNANLAARKPANEPILTYAPGKPERGQVKEMLRAQSAEVLDIPLIIGGREVRTATKAKCVMPHDHGHVLAEYSVAGPEEVRAAIGAALKAKREWESLPWTHRVTIFLKAAELLAGPWRARVNAATMLGVSKTVFQAEIDAACELIDFFRFNSRSVSDILGEQPESTQDAWNRFDWRPLEGFVFAATPFNFTSIAGNLPTAPAMVGNTVVWKPASSAVYPAYHVMKLLMAAGIPAGVINFVPGPGKTVGDVVLGDENLAGVHFTGSTETFQSMWKTVGSQVGKYRTYPRLVGETGGKDFVLAHSSADAESLVTALVRGAFEYQGQKCSAASRAYVPKSLWPRVQDGVISRMSEIKAGNIMDFRNFMGAVIDDAAYRRIKGYLDFARASNEASVYGGECDDTVGYFIRPALIVTTNPHFKTMEEEIFGPVLTVYVYEDTDYADALELCDTTSPYGLTGAVFASDRAAIQKAEVTLRHAAGNFYVNDKPTGATVGQQPFGGARASGTNDKAGSKLNLYRWMSPRVIKESLNPPTDYKYPFMTEE